MKKNKETGRDVYMSDAVFSAILLAGDQSVKDAMRIGKMTGADIGVILTATTRQIEGDALRMQRTKTGSAVRFRLRDESGDLAPEVINLLHAPALAPTAAAPSVARLSLGR